MGYGDPFVGDGRGTEVFEQRCSGFHVHRPTPLSDDGEVSGEMVFVDQFIGEFPQGENGGLAECESDLDLFPGADSGGDSDSLGGTRAGARIGVDDEEGFQGGGDGGGASVEGDEAVGVGDEVGDDGQAGEGGEIVHRDTTALGSVGAGVEF